MAKGDTLVWIVLGLLAVYFFFPNALSGFGKGTTTSGTSTTSGTCFLDSINLKVNDEALGKAGTNPGLSSAIFIDGTDYGDLADNTALTVPTGHDYKIYAGWNAGTPGTYYTVKKTGNTDCVDPLQITTPLPRRVGLQTANWSVYTTDWDGTIVPDANATNANNNVSITANDDKTVVLHLRLPLDFYYGNPEATSNVLVLEAMPGLYDKLEIVGGTVTSLPRSHRTSTKDKFAFSVSTIKSNTEFVQSIRLKTGVINPAGGSNLTSGFYVYLYDADYDLDADLNTEIIGVEDEDNNALGVALPWITYVPVE